MSWRIVKEGALPSLSLGTLKHYLRVEHDLDDGLLRHLINVAREYIETYTRKLLGEKTLEITLNKHSVEIGKWMSLPIGPLNTLEHVSVRKRDGDWVDIPLPACEVGSRGVRIIDPTYSEYTDLHSMCVVGKGGVGLTPLIESVWLTLVQQMYVATEVDLNLIKHTLHPLCVNEPLTLI